MNKKAFTLVELLVTILLISIVSGLCVVSYTTIINHSNPKFYKSIEENIELAASDYVLDHRDKNPVGNSIEQINLGDLEDGKYVEKVIDVNGNHCTGKIVVYKENKRIKYDVCLTCGDYKSSGPHCQ